MNINTKKYIEEYLIIRDKNSKLIKFKFNKAQQKLYDTIKALKEQGKPVRIIIEKARQMGFSTMTEAVLFKETATKSNINTGIITHKEDSTTNLFNMNKLFYDNLPKPLQPNQKYSNAKEIIFDRKDGQGLKSKIKCMTAGGSGVGRSDTYNNLHLSELAFWEGDKKATYVGLMQSVPNTPDTIVIIESTANGYEFFKELWDGAVAGENDYTPLFFAWYEQDEYRMHYTEFELTKKEQELKAMYNLDNDQLEWRRWCIANNCGGDEELFKQEYPSNPEEAFISTGNCIFDKDIIINRLNSIKNSYKEENELKIYKEVEQGHPYVIGVDTAGPGIDYNVAQVIDNYTKEQVAVLRTQEDLDIFTQHIVELAERYNKALLSIEANFDTYPIRKAEELGYTNQYMREKVDEITHQLKKSYGFKTTMVTKPIIIDNLKQLIRENADLINDKDTLRELLTFVRHNNGKMGAEQGKHDDLVMALAIAYQTSEQQRSTLEEEKKSQYIAFSEEQDFLEY